MKSMKLTEEQKDKLTDALEECALEAGPWLTMDEVMKWLQSLMDHNFAFYGDQEYGRGFGAGCKYIENGEHLTNPFAQLMKDK